MNKDQHAELVRNVIKEVKMGYLGSSNVEFNANTIVGQFCNTMDHVFQCLTSTPGSLIQVLQSTCLLILNFLFL